MKTKAYIAALFILLASSCRVTQVSSVTEQQDLISKLTGHSTISENTVMKDRASIESRKLTADYLMSMLEEFADDSYLHNYRENGNNVVGLIKSTVTTDSYIVLGAHFDSVPNCPGANDNATGTALVFSVAKYISELKSRNHNVLIVFFDEEEKGLLGSKAFAKKIKDEGLDVHSVHTVDQLGWDDDGDRAIELEMPTDELQATYIDVAKKLKLDFPIHYSKVTSTDHRSFRNLGFKATGITEEYVNKDTTPHYHKATDTYETVNFEYLNFVTSYVQEVFKELLEN
jgi:Zn-dependent M28 family amino/carboxypeptidase